MTQVCNDVGSGAKKDMSVWRPDLPEGFVLLGDHVKTGYSRPVSAAIIGKDDGHSFAEPEGFNLEWYQEGGDQPIYVLRPHAPEGFVALGVYISTSDDVFETGEANDVMESQEHFGLLHTDSHLFAAIPMTVLRGKRHLKFLPRMHDLQYENKPWCNIMAWHSFASALAMQEIDSTQ
eukprot:gene1332-1930_t